MAGESDAPKTDQPSRRAQTILRAFCYVAKRHLTRMMQASLVRAVAYAMFADDPDAFDGHPDNISMTWHALEALEGNAVVGLVELFHDPRHRQHVPPSVAAKVEALRGHRNVVSHPAKLKPAHWTDPKMKQFETEGRRYEWRVPLIWDLQQVLNEECGPAAIPDFVVTNEMVGLLRTLLEAAVLPDQAGKIPDAAGLATLLQGYRDATLQRCRDRANGVPPPPRRETKLDRKWAAVERGEDPDSVT